MRTARPGFIVGVAIVASLWAIPAWAHLGTAAQPYVAAFNVSPAGNSTWNVAVRLVDRDSGSPAPGFGVSLHGMGPAGAMVDHLALADQGNGQYTAAASAAPGTWQFTVAVASIPGGAEGIPFSQQTAAVLSAGAASAGTPSGASHPMPGHGHGGAGVWLLAAVVGAALLLTAGLVLWRRPGRASGAGSSQLHYVGRRS
jgi:hypothetical protein